MFRNIADGFIANRSDEVSAKDGELSRRIRASSRRFLQEWPAIGFRDDFNFADHFIADGITDAKRRWLYVKH